MKILPLIILSTLLAGCGTPATQKPLFERTLKRDVYYCISNSISSKDFDRIKVIEKIVNVPQEDDLFKYVKKGKDYVFIGGSQCGTFPYPSTAYFKWIDVSTGKIYEETANLHEALEGMSVHGSKIIFRISSDNKLYIYLEKRDASNLKPKTWPKDPYMDLISEYKFWQLHPQPSPTKGLK